MVTHNQSSSSHICWKEEEFWNEDESVGYFCVFYIWLFSWLMNPLLTHLNAKKASILIFTFSDSPETKLLVSFYFTQISILLLIFGPFLSKAGSKDRKEHKMLLKN